MTASHDLIGKTVSIGGKVYTIVKSTLDDEQCISLFNKFNNTFLRHNNGLLKEHKYSESILYKKDSSWFFTIKDNYINFSCANGNLLDYYIAEVNDILIISKLSNKKITTIDFPFINNQEDLLLNLFDSVGQLKHNVAKLSQHFELHHPLTVLPKAGGNLRIFQQDGVELLQFFDKICAKYKLSYWIDYGTLLGAVRHQGYIPWDDDLDVCMMYDDFMEFNQIIDKELLNEPIKYTHNFHPYIYKLVSTKRQKRNAWLDIFPFYYMKDNVDIQEYKRNFKEARKERALLVKRNDIDEIRKFALDYNDKYRSSMRTETIFRGFQAADNPLCDVKSYKEVFPLTKITFEDVLLYCPNNYLDNLKNLYGNWMEYPDVLKSHHSW